MKVLILNGSPRANGNTSLAVKEMEKVFAENGIETESVLLGTKDIRGWMKKANRLCVFLPETCHSL